MIAIFTACKIQVKKYYTYLLDWFLQPAYWKGCEKQTCPIGLLEFPLFELLLPESKLLRWPEVFSFMFGARSLSVSCKSFKHDETNHCSTNVNLQTAIFVEEAHLFNAVFLITLDWKYWHVKDYSASTTCIYAQNKATWFDFDLEMSSAEPSS